MVKRLICNQDIEGSTPSFGPMEKTLYKIRQKSDGLFSAGGTYPRFTSVGKIWKKGPLHSHLNLVKRADNEDIYDDCEIVAIELREINSTDVRQYNEIRNS